MPPLSLCVCARPARGGWRGLRREPLSRASTPSSCSRASWVRVRNKVTICTFQGLQMRRNAKAACAAGGCGACAHAARVARRRGEALGWGLRGWRGTARARGWRRFACTSESTAAGPRCAARRASAVARGKRSRPASELCSREGESERALRALLRATRVPERGGLAAHLTLRPAPRRPLDCRRRPRFTWPAALPLGSARQLKSKRSRRGRRAGGARGRSAGCHRISQG